MPSQAQLQQMWDSVVNAKVDANPQLCWHHYTLRRFQQRLYVVQPHASIDHVVLPCAVDTPCVLPSGLGTLCLQCLSVQPQTVQPKNPEVQDLELPASSVVGRLRLPNETEPVTIRFAAPAGVEVCPVGRAGKRKLKKLYQEYGVPSWQRRRLPLIFYGDQLVAVAGLFVVQAFAGEACDDAGGGDNHVCDIVWSPRDQACAGE